MRRAIALKQSLTLRRGLLRREQHPPRNDGKGVMTKIKICGIKTLTDALAAIDAGADYLGFNFYPKSPRFIEKNACAEITSILKTEHLQIKLVGVFVNASVEEVKDILDTCSLDWLNYMAMKQ